MQTAALIMAKPDFWRLKWLLTLACSSLELQAASLSFDLPLRHSLHWEYLIVGPKQDLVGEMLNLLQQQIIFVTEVSGISYAVIDISYP